MAPRLGSSKSMIKTRDKGLQKGSEKCFLTSISCRSRLQDEDTHDRWRQSANTDMVRRQQTPSMMIHSIDMFDCMNIYVYTYLYIGLHWMDMISVVLT